MVPVFFILALLMVLLAMGTFIRGIPVLSSVANTITVTGAHIYLLVQAVVLIAAFVLDLGLEPGCRWLLLTVLTTCLISEVVIIQGMVHAVGAAGVPVKVMAAYWPHLPRGVQVDTHVYGDRSNSLLNVYYRDDGKTNKPVIIYTHGGGWFYGSKEDRTYYHKNFAEDGYVVVSIDYALSHKSNHYAGETEAQILDGLRWVLANIDRYNASVDQWCFAGDSAGGNLALNLGFKINSGYYTQPDGRPFPLVAAVSVTYPIADPAAFYANTDCSMKIISRYSATSYTGGSPETHPEVYDQITPANFLSPQSPPVCVVMGDQDAAVPPDGTYALLERMNGLGLMTKLINIPHANHACDTFWGSIASQSYIHVTRHWFALYRAPEDVRLRLM